MSREIPPACETWNWPAYKEAMKQRAFLTIWFDPEKIWTPPGTGKHGR